VCSLPIERRRVKTDFESGQALINNLTSDDALERDEKREEKRRERFRTDLTSGTLTFLAPRLRGVSAEPRRERDEEADNGSAVFRRIVASFNSVEFQERQNGRPKKNRGNALRIIRVEFSRCYSRVVIHSRGNHCPRISSFASLSRFDSANVHLSLSGKDYNPEKAGKC